MNDERLNEKARNARQAVWFIKTTDDWGGNYPGDTVRVIVHELFGPPHREWVKYHCVRIAVWGNDDGAMHKDLPEHAWDEALAEAKAFPEPITKKWLAEHGYQVF